MNWTEREAEIRSRLKAARTKSRVNMDLSPDDIAACLEEVDRLNDRLREEGREKVRMVTDAGKRIVALRPTKEEAALIFRTPDDCGENCMDDLELCLCAHSEKSVPTDLIYGHFKGDEMGALRQWMRRVRKALETP